MGDHGYATAVTRGARWTSTEAARDDIHAILPKACRARQAGAILLRT